MNRKSPIFDLFLSSVYSVYVSALAFATYINEPTRLMRVAIATVIVNSLAYIVDRVGRDLRVATATSGGTSEPGAPS